MKGRVVQYTRYGAAGDVLQVVEEANVAPPTPTELLVRVRASSVNPIDCAVRRGYGHEFFEAKGLSAWPMRPGRDIAGEGIAVGSRVSGFSPAERIFAATLGGANADFARMPASWAAAQPSSLDFLQAASLPYSALTTWSALVDAAGLNSGNTAGKRVLITRAAGGVGSFAVQLVKAWGGYVAASCSTRNVEFVRALGVDRVIDYSREDLGEAVRDFDVAFDTSFDTEQSLLKSLKTHGGASYVSIVTPKLKFIDQYGLEEGLRRGDALLAERIAAQQALGRSYHWSFTQPNGKALQEVAALVDAGKIRPVIDRRFPLAQIAAAHEYSESGQARGKIIIDLH